MPPCVDLSLPTPALPPLLYGPPVFPNVPAFEGDFCCHFAIRPDGVNDLINAANAGIAATAAGAAAPILIAIMGINELVAEGVDFLNGEIKNHLPECPLESASVSF